MNYHTYLVGWCPSLSHISVLITNSILYLAIIPWARFMLMFTISMSHQLTISLTPRYTMDGLIIMVDGTTYMNLPTQLILHTDYKEKVFIQFFLYLIMVLYANNTPMNISINPGVPPIIVNQSPPPWYVQYLPEFIIAAGIVVTALTFYFSPELRSIIKRATSKLK